MYHCSSQIMQPRSECSAIRVALNHLFSCLRDFIRSRLQAFFNLLQENQRKRSRCSIPISISLRGSNRRAFQVEPGGERERRRRTLLWRRGFGAPGVPRCRSLARSC